MKRLDWVLIGLLSMCLLVWVLAVVEVIHLVKGVS
jgi:hypothetical protein